MSKHFYFEQLSLAKYSFNIKAILFQTIQFSMITQFDPLIEPCPVLPLRTTVDLAAMAMKGYSAFPKAPVILEPHHQIVQCHI